MNKNQNNLSVELPLDHRSNKVAKREREGKIASIEQ